jgi:hypothetical protein
MANKMVASKFRAPYAQGDYTSTGELEPQGFRIILSANSLPLSISSLVWYTYTEQN